MKTTKNMALLKRSSIIFLLFPVMLFGCTLPNIDNETSVAQSTNISSSPPVTVTPTTEALSETTISTSPENAIEDFSLTNLENTLPIFHVALLSCHLYNDDGTRNYWQALYEAVTTFVSPDSRNINYYVSASRTYDGIPCSFEEVKFVHRNTGDDLLQVPGWIVREFSYALFPDHMENSDFSDSNTFSYTPELDYCYFAINNKFRDCYLDIVDYEEDTDNSYIVSFQTTTFGPDPVTKAFPAKVRIIKNTHYTDGNPPLFPYTISEVISAESDEQGGDSK